MKKLFIVGGSSGIGFATVKKFLQNGYSVINLSRTPCQHAGVENYLCDVSVPKQLDDTLSKIVKVNSIDIFIYCAGFSMASPIEFVRENDYRYLYEVNLFAFLRCVQTLVPLLRKSEGTICVISSLGSICPIPYDCYYSGSKNALNATVQSLKYELLLDNVNVISILCGGTKTNFSFKRKIYPYSTVGGYSKQMHLAVERLKNIEQNGLSAEKVATFIYKKCHTHNVSVSLYPNNFINKIIAFFVRIAPQSLIYFITKNVYFCQEED